MKTLAPRILENRLPPPLVTLVIALAMWGIERMRPAISFSPLLRYALAGSIGLFGLIVGPSGILEFRRRKTTINPVQIEQASQLVTTGIYRFTRNPMYVGLAALLTAWAIYLAVPSALLGPIVFALFTNRFQIIPEERAMSAKFGSAYDEYRSRVRRWV
jgi:protein-S-isoprenylcysteine O-methyltransferase Ste14